MKDDLSLELRTNLGLESTPAGAQTDASTLAFLALDRLTEAAARVNELPASMLEKVASLPANESEMATKVLRGFEAFEHLELALRLLPKDVFDVLVKWCLEFKRKLLAGQSEEDLLQDVFGTTAVLWFAGSVIVAYVNRMDIATQQLHSKIQVGIVFRAESWRSKISKLRWILTETKVRCCFFLLASSSKTRFFLLLTLALLSFPYSDSSGTHRSHLLPPF